MFRWGIIFLVIALIAAALGFGGLAGTAAWAACGYYSVPGQPVYRASTSIANAIFHQQNKASHCDWLFLICVTGRVRYCGVIK